MRIDAKIQMFIIGALLLLASTSCKDPQEVSVDMLLLNCWTHSYEEQTSDDIRVYRPCDFKEWPNLRYRESFTLQDNSEANYLVLSPSDAHYFSNATWIYNQDSSKLNIFDSDSIVRNYEVIEVKADKLVLKY